MTKCSAVFSYSEELYRRDYRCQRDEHDSDSFHFCEAVCLTDITLGSGNKYSMKIDPVQWKTEGVDLVFLTPFLPTDVMTGETPVRIVGKPSTVNPGWYGKQIRICIENILYTWNDGTPPSYVTRHDIFRFIWS